MEKSVGQRRIGMVNDAFQLKQDVDHCNEVNPDQRQIPLVLDLTDDVAEMEAAGSAGNEEAAWSLFLHRAAAAACAISERCLGVRAAARAVPPLIPPLRWPSAFGVASRASPVAKSTMSLASWLGSRGRLG